MDELHRAADKLRRELEILDLMEWNQFRDQSRRQVELILAQTKRVRNASTLLVRELAQRRDELQP